MLLDDSISVRQFTREFSEFPSVSEIGADRYKTREGNIFRVLRNNDGNLSKIQVETNGEISKEIPYSNNLKVTSAGIWKHYRNKIELVLRFGRIL